MLDEDLGYCETEKSVRGLRTIEQANSLRDLTEYSLRQARVLDDYKLQVKPRPDGLFDLIVLMRVN